MESYHKSVLTKETTEGLNIKPHGIYIDATFGGGGHTKAILETEPTCKVLAIDWDKTAIKKNGPELEKQFPGRIKLIHSNFARLHFILKKEKLASVDGIVADFGTSQHQIHHKEGFSFLTDSPLDMRMSPQHQRITAALVVNTFTQRSLEEVFFEFGEERNGRKFAKAIIEQRKRKKIETTLELAKIIEEAAPPAMRHRRTHPATKAFQALRIFVNRELENIEIFLKEAIKILSPGGRIVCISFHSLEDRIVKNIFRENEHLVTQITRKPTVPSDTEISTNPSSRSAKLRIAQKIDRRQKNC